MTTVAIIIPTYGGFDYARRAVLSALKYTTATPHVLVVDDASPNWGSAWWDSLLGELRSDPYHLTLYRFGQNGGLTRSWNFGLQWARDHGYEFTVPSNSDVIFTPGWDEGLRAAIQKGYYLVGPLSNAPGHTNPKVQQVAVWQPDYRLTDDPAYLASLAETLKGDYGGIVKETNVNGFCLMSSTEIWWKHAYDKTHVFNPRHRMTFNEDELQRRWRGKMGLRTGVALDSFVFHYRAVTRGKKARMGRWYRAQDPKRPV
jgi:GT2 family glycosyltransferase